MSDVVRWRLRPDLIAETIRMGHRLIRILKDPVSGRFFHFEPREFSILELLDGRRSPEDIFAAIRQARPDEVVSPENILRFLAQARSSGLILVHGGTAAAPAEKTPRESSLLAARIPLFNPASTLARWRPFLRVLFETPAACAWTILVVSALLLVVGRFDDFAARLPEAQAWATPSMVLTILAVIGACKVVHELAHAITADHFGVRVQECGVMLFYFLPCFYCDVSDAWLLRSPRQRIAISAAGMLAELGLAAAATWLWWFSQPGPVQSICLAVMVTCSINTLLLNGNPLMRFDGYFVFVDLLGIPNLAARAREWWVGLWEWLVFGFGRGIEIDRESALLATYGAASVAYRLLVLAAMLLGIHAAFDARGAGIVSLGLIALAIASVGKSLAQTVARPLRDPLSRRVLNRRRTGLGLGTVLILLLGALLLPLPRTVEADFVIEFESSTPVFTRTAGELLSIVEPGTQVQPGQEIARLENLDLRRRLAELESRKAQTERQLESARIQRTVDPTAGQTIPALMEAVAGLEERLSIARKEVAELIVTAPTAGSVHEPANIPPHSPQRHELPTWSGTPFDRQNLGSTLQAGTDVAIVAASDRRSAVALVSQRRIELLRPGQHVRLASAGNAMRPLPGTVVEISPAPIDAIPRELATTAASPSGPLPIPPNQSPWNRCIASASNWIRGAISPPSVRSARPASPSPGPPPPAASGTSPPNHSAGISSTRFIAL